MRLILIMVLLVVVGAFFVPKPQSNNGGAAKSVEVAQSMGKIDQYISEHERLQKIKIQKWSWKKDGFGSVMMATFVLQNTNDKTVKDIEITCEHFGNSGTLIDKNIRTIYETINAKATKTIGNFNMGFVHSQATKSSCTVTGYT
jgi:hypothetical protein